MTVDKRKLKWIKEDSNRWYYAVDIEAPHGAYVEKNDGFCAIHVFMDRPGDSLRGTRKTLREAKAACEAYLAVVIDVGAKSCQR